ncbi:hypothetical protein BDP27DRAFT_1362501 [Rhodocollybia butyracea]|uniref:Uncharacterized protein n=1 Tax=Rhodocollybia butyracea TaxID=206335 RepID=A0A9P5PWN2_9AGAR|nr:hypothetical protein BDP27DRAFT_1362501 [Rhodocollybia butyracea]
MSNPPSALGLGVDLSAMQDGLFYGYVVATALFGVTIVQAWIYIQTNRDKWPLRTLVGVLMTITWEIFISLGVVFCVQMFFASRVWLHSRSSTTVGQTHWTVPVFIILTAVGGGAAGFAQAIGEFQNSNEPNLVNKRPKIELTLNATLDFVSDITTTVALAWTVKRMNSGSSGQIHCSTKYFIAILNSRDSHRRTDRSSNHLITDSDMPVSKAVAFETSGSSVGCSHRSEHFPRRGDFSVTEIDGNGSDLKRPKEADSDSDNFDIEVGFLDEQLLHPNEIRVTTTVSTHRDLPPQTV